jgi:hypothetical protein
LNNNVANFGSNAHAIHEEISGTSQIPLRSLLGSERGELASSQDRLNLDERIKKRRTRFAVARVVRPFIDRLILHNALVKPANGIYFAEWNESEKISTDSQSVIVERISRANKAQKDSGDTEIMTSEEIRDGILGLEPLEDSESDSEEDLEDNDQVDGDEDEEIDIRVNSLAAADDSEPEWRAIHRVADKNRRLLARELRESWDETGRRIDDVALLSAIERRDKTTTDKLLTGAVNDLLNPDLLPVVQSRLQQTLIQGAQATLKAGKSRGSWFVKERSSTRQLASVGEGTSGVGSTIFNMSFNSVNPRAVTYALTRSSELVTQITPDTLSGLQSIIALGTETGIPPRRQVQQIRELIGLRDDQVKAMYNLSQRLVSAKPGTIVKAGKVKIKIPRKGVTREFVEAQVDKYGKRLLNQRSLLISRTETMRSANQGQVELWRQGQENGLLPDTIKREWIVTDDSRLREEHAEMAGQKVGIEESFSPIPEPGSEPACRCSQGLVED